MSKLTKRDFDDYLGKDNFYNEEDKEQFYRKLNPSKGWKKHWIPQTITVAMVIGIFLLAVQLYQGNLPFTSTEINEEGNDSTPETVEETDWSSWIVAESTEDVDAFYENTIPGFRIAEELNQVIDINQKHALTDNVSLYIDKAWYHEDKIHLFYSMDLVNDEIVTNNHETGVITEFQFDGDSESSLPLASPSSWSGVVFSDAFNNKLYRVSTITLEEEEQLLKQEQLTASFAIDAHNEDVTLSEIELPVSYGKETITSNSINDSIQTANSNITLTRYDKGADKGYLYFTVDSTMGQEIEFLNGFIKIGNGEDIYLMDRTIGVHKDTFVLDIPELVTEEVTIDFEYVSMIEKEDTIDLSIDVSNYDHSVAEDFSEITMNQKVDEVFNTEIYLESITYDELGVTVGMTTETIEPSNSANLHLTSIVPVLADWGSWMTNKIEATNDNGETTTENHFHSIGKYVEDDNYRIHTFGLVWSFIQDANEVNFTIKDLSIGEDINQTITIPIQD
ncbi:hypothetical protein [Ornithinibacillus halophilus]|uniref:DUF4179 domain-containing protein n=1 Tax=Ornithinibacillus halophilus TaxID=930117 RepID=A0A1M5L569_9BACI|nr:hypothetical protein [Ornithinibacillus halophilus]SHG60100.1 hypothetical protein SAMN05216225_104414 [Ornithinibacillus halophilus]